jgi:hypothetical protein
MTAAPEARRAAGPGAGDRPWAVLIRSLASPEAGCAEGDRPSSRSSERTELDRAEIWLTDMMVLQRIGARILIAGHAVRRRAIAEQADDHGGLAIEKSVKPPT